MNSEKFKNTERQYNELKEKHNAGEISAEEMKKKLKSLMLLDDSGRYWMIGGKSGKWYTYNGKEWQESNPYPVEAEPVSTEEHIDTSDNPFPSQSGYSIYGDDVSQEEDNVRFQEREHTTTTIDFESESEGEPTTEHSEEYKQNVYEASPQTRTLSTLVTPKAEAKNEPVSPSRSLAEEQKSPSRETTYKQSTRNASAPQQSSELELKKITPPTYITIKQISLLPAMLFSGGLGSIIGVIFGAMFGIFKILESLSSVFPMMLVEMRGKVFGGLLFAAIGGLAGFILLALLGALVSLFYNTVSSVFCGLRIKVRTE